LLWYLYERLVTRFSRNW